VSEEIPRVFSEFAVGSQISTLKARQGQGRGALLGYIPAGQTLRELAVEPGGHTLLATDNNSGQLQAILP
jgi:hypothetical protein